MGVIGDIAGAVIGAKASKKASKAMVQAAEMGIAEQRRQYDQTRADFAPWREAGGKAIGNLSAMLEPGYDYKTSPGYQFRFNEGQRAVESSGAAKGLLMSGGTLKDLVRFGDGVAAADFGDTFNRQASIAAGGQQVNTTLGQLGANMANNISDMRTQQGNARASGYVGAANAWIGGINNFNDRLASMFGGGFGG